MAEAEGIDATRSPVAEFRTRLAQDRADGRSLPLAAYLELFPGDDRGVAEAFLALGPGEGSATAGRSRALGAAERLGPYRIAREIGRGGQGIVYLAEDERLGRKVALKVLTALVSASPSALARFRREAEVASRLHHPGICTVFEAGTHEDVPYIAMQHVEGESLARRLARQRTSGAPESVHLDLATETATLAGDAPAPREAPPTPSGPARRADVMQVVELIEKAARALQVAHDAGVIHRDIKPGNIIVDAAGDPVILDFGLARDQGGAATLTGTDEVFGTPAYMSPEQLTREADALDGRTDVYALGVTLFECLTLRRPFEEPTRQSLYHAILTKAPPDVRRLNAAVPRDLKVVIDTALEKDRARRYQSARAFADDLRRVRLLEPVAARPAGAPLRLLRAAQRNPAAAAMSVLLLAGLVAGTGIVSYSLGEAASARKEKEDAERRRTEIQQELDRLRQNLEIVDALNDHAAATDAPPPEGAPIGVQLLVAGPLLAGGAERGVMAPAPEAATGLADGTPALRANVPPPAPFADGPAVDAIRDPRLRRAIGEIVRAPVPAAGAPGRSVRVRIEAAVREVASEDRPAVAAALAAYGDALEGGDAPGLAAEVYEQAQDLYGASGDARAQAAVNLSRALALEASGRADAAAEALARSRRLFDATGDRGSAAAVQVCEANVLCTTGKLDDALRGFDDAVAAFDALGDAPRLAGALLNRGRVRVGCGRFEDGLADLRRAHALGAAVPGWRHPSGVWVARAERLVALARRLDALRAEGAAAIPDDPEELRALAVLAAERGHLPLAVDLFERFFATDPPGDLAVLQGLAAAAAARALAALPPGRDDAAARRLARVAQSRLAAMAASVAAASPRRDATLERALEAIARDPGLDALRRGPLRDRLDQDARAAFDRAFDALAALRPAR